ncbi:ABC transporter ATP-binding protein [Corticibacter populi]|uniref:ABC transporter ATP-binding protein n=1 Tax=Corticibacter populi TaxID=1550736 RepID=A0A3M6QSG6_9BURK|nr:ABC transporter ATP-binding protein [Corticibacter populi]RMX05974.1 ABC transporter ATP-binding protein [Corticibacter populi]RZS30695.1 putative ABC transport system ATP-binding protein [Corticibacter populi]
MTESNRSAPPWPQQDVPTQTAILQVRQLEYRWPGQSAPCLVIDDFAVMPGETVFLYGPSGSGKSTLLSLLAGVFLPQRGEVLLGGQDWARLRGARRDRYRADMLGYIFQQFNLLPYLSVQDNVLLPCRFSTSRAQAAIAQHGSLPAASGHWLAAMGLPRSSWQRPARALSVGQQQRVAAARALIGAPPVIIADEPTSALDENRRDAFMDLLLAACREAGSTLVFVSHDQRLADRFSRQVSLPAINHAAIEHIDAAEDEPA